MQTAQNASGSALAENDKYLSSIEGKMQKFKAAYESMSMSMLSSGMVKGFVEIGTALTRMIEGLSKAHALLPAIVGAITAISSIKAGNTSMGILNELFNGGITDNTKNIVQAMNSFQKANIANVLKANLSAETFSTVNRELGLISETAAQAGSAGVAAATGIGGAFSRAGTSIKTAIAGMSMFSKVAIGISVAMLAFSAISSAIEKHNQKIIENAQKVSDTYKEAQTNYESNLKTVTDLRSEYDRLSKGVDVSNNRNISLSTDEYERFLEINNQLAETIPGIADGFDSQGNAIINTADAISKAVSTLSDANKDATQNYLAGGDDLFKGQKKEWNTAAKELVKDGSVVTKAFGYVNEAVGTKIADAFKAAGVSGASFDADMQKITFTASGLVQSVDNLDEVMSKLRATGLDLDFDAIESSIRSVSTQASAVKDAIAPMVDYAMTEFSQSGKSQYDWFPKIPQEQTEAFKAQIADMWDFSKSKDENIKTISDYGNELAQAFDSIPSNLKSSMDNMQDAINDGKTVTQDELQGFNNLVSDFYNELASGGGANAQQVADFMLGYLNTFTQGVKTSSESVAASFQDMVTSSNIDMSNILGGDDKANDFSKQTQEYLNNVNDLQNALKTLNSDKDLTPDQLKALKNILGDDVAPTIDNITDKLTELNQNTDAQWAEVIKNAAEGDKDALLALKEEILSLGDVTSAFSLDLDMTKETESFTNLVSAIGEANGATGLSAASITNLRARYAEVAQYASRVGDEQLNLNSLFEASSTGVRLNNEQLSKMETAYGELKQQQIDRSINAMVKQLNSLNKEYESYGNKSSEVARAKKQEIDSLKNNIENARLLAAEYKGLTSDFNQWQQATQTANQGANYDAIAEGVSSIKELHNAGKIGVDDYIKGVEMMTDATYTMVDGQKKAISDLTHDEYNDYLERVYSGTEKMLDAQGEVIKKANGQDAVWAGMKGMERYFKDGETGIRNFLTDVNKMDTELAHAGSDGKWEVNIDEASFDRIRQNLGLTTEEAEIMAQKLQEYGYNVSFNQIADNLEEAYANADNALKSLRESGTVDQAVVIDVRTDSIDQAEADIKYLTKTRDALYDSHGNLIDPSNQAKVEQLNEVIEAAIQNKEMLEHPLLMSIEADTTTSAGNAIHLLQQLEEQHTVHEIEFRRSGTDDTSEIEATLAQLNTGEVLTQLVALGIIEEGGQLTLDNYQDVLAQIESNPEIEQTIKAALDIETDTASTDTTEINVDGTLHIVKVDIEGVGEEAKTIEGGTIKVSNIDVSGINPDSGGGFFSKLGSLLTGKQSDTTIDVTAKISKVESGELTSKPIDITGKITKIEQSGVTTKPINVTAKIKNVETGGLKTDKSLKVQAKISKLDTSGLKTNQKVDVTARVSQVEATNMHTANTVDVKAKVTKVDTSALKGATGSINVKATVSSVSTGNVRATVNATAVVDQVTGLTAPTATVVFNRDSSAVDSYNPPNMTRTITYVYRTSGSRPNPHNISRTITYTYRTVGKKPSKAQGSAMSSGSAFKGGSWGVHGNGIGLVGELAPEILVSKKPPHTVTYVEYFS